MTLLLLRGRLLLEARRVFKRISISWGEKVKPNKENSKRTLTGWRRQTRGWQNRCRSWNRKDSNSCLRSNRLRSRSQRSESKTKKCRPSLRMKLKRLNKRTRLISSSYLTKGGRSVSPRRFRLRGLKSRKKRYRLLLLLIYLRAHWRSLKIKNLPKLISKI